jgi:nucleotide-binding universal stress UspA family protein
MGNIQKILVAYDASPQSREALHWAIFFSRRTRATISVVKVYDSYLRQSLVKEVGVLPEGMLEYYAGVPKSDLQLMEEVKDLGRDQGLEVTTAVLQGHVVQTLLEYAKNNGISMIIAGTHGHSALSQLLQGGTTHSLVSLADVPVLVVKNHPAVPSPELSLFMSNMQKILVAYDGYPQSKAALSWAVEIAKIIGAEVTAVTVFETFHMGLAYTMSDGGSESMTAAKLQEIEEKNASMMEEAKDLAKEQGMEISTQLLNGSVLEGLLEYTENNGIDIVVVGAQGRWVLDKLPLGSVPHGLISLSPVPVMVVKK